MLDASHTIDEYLQAHADAQAAMLSEMYGGVPSGPICQPCNGAGSFSDPAPAHYSGSIPTFTRCLFCEGSGRAR